MSTASPNSSTQVAKLVSTLTGHMIASLNLLNDCFTFPALSIVQVILEKVDFMFGALAFMGKEKTLITECFSTMFAGWVDFNGNL